MSNLCCCAHVFVSQCLLAVYHDIIDRSVISGSREKKNYKTQSVSNSIEKREKSDCKAEKTLKMNSKIEIQVFCCAIPFKHQWNDLMK